MAQPEIKKEKFQRSHPLLVTMIIGLTILSVGYFIYVLPAANQARKFSTKDILELQVELGRKQTRLFSIKNLARDFDDLPSELIQKMQAGLPTQPNSIDLLANLPALVEASGLQLKSIQLTELMTQSVEATSETRQLEVKEVLININVEGLSYTVLKRFIRNLETNLRLLRLNDFQFDVGSASTVFNLTAFYL